MRWSVSTQSDGTMQPPTKRTLLTVFSSLAAAGLLTGAGCMLPSLESPGDASSDVDAAASPDGISVEDGGCDPSTADATTGPNFDEVKQLVVDNCVECHREGQQAATTSMIFSSESPSNTEIERALQGTAANPEETPLLEAGNPDNSAIFLRTKEENPPEMPTGNGWSGDEDMSETTLENWIAGGAQIPTCD